MLVIETNAQTITSCLNALDKKNFDYSEVTIYPNPSSNFITIKCLNVIDKVELFNTTGFFEYLNTTDINISKLSGIYFLKIYSKGEKTFKKLLNNKFYNHIYIVLLNKFNFLNFTMMNNETSIFGIRAIIEAINSGENIDKVFIQKGLRELIPATRNHFVGKSKISTSYVPIEKLNRLTKENHQGAVAHISPIKFYEYEELVSSAL